MLKNENIDLFYDGRVSAFSCFANYLENRNDINLEEEEADDD